MRLFVAIPLPDFVIEKLCSLSKPMPGLKWTDPEQYHLTLRFLGDVSQKKKEQICNRLGTIRHEIFEMDIDGFGFFPNARRPRVFWAGVVPNPELMGLQEKVENVCRDVGFEAETQSYVPHITLAKIKDRPDGLDTFLNRNQDFGIASVPVNCFNLYRSKLQKQKAVHTVIKSYELDK